MSSRRRHALMWLACADQGAFTICLVFFNFVAPTLMLHHCPLPQPLPLRMCCVFVSCGSDLVTFIIGYVLPAQFVYEPASLFAVTLLHVCDRWLELYLKLLVYAAVMMCA